MSSELQVYDLTMLELYNDLRRVSEVVDKNQIRFVVTRYGRDCLGVGPAEDVRALEALARLGRSVVATMQPDSAEGWQDWGVLIEWLGKQEED